MDFFGVDIDELLKSGGLNISDYQYLKGLNDDRILINEDISSSIVESAVLPLMEMDSNPDVKHIDIMISTYGGEVYYGLLLADVIEKLNTNTTITILGVAASMGTLIAMSGHNNPNVKTVCYPHCVGLLHDGSYYVDGTLHSVRDNFHFNERYEEKIKQYVLSHSSMSEDFYSQHSRVEYWMTAEDMVENGIVDEIL